MSTFKGTKKEWCILIRALFFLEECMKIDDGDIIPDGWEDMTVDEVGKLFFFF